MKFSKALIGFAAAVVLGVLPQVTPVGFATPAAYATSIAAGDCSDSSGELICNVDDENLSFSQTSSANQNTATVNILASALVGDSVRYENVFTGDDGTIVDALVEVTAVPTGASDVDRDDSGSFGSHPILMFPGTGSLSVSVNFVDNSDNAVKMQNLQLVVKDLDKDGRIEFAEFTGLTSYTLDTNTDLIASEPSPGVRRFTGTTSLGSTNQVGWVVVNFPTVSTIGLTGGHSSSSGGGIGFSFQGGTVLSTPATPVPVAAATYTVSFDLDGGSGTVPTSVSGSGELIFPSASGQSKSGVNLSGWTAVSGGSGTRVALGGSYTPISDTTFYAEYDGASVGSPSTTSGTVGEAFSSSVSTSGFASSDLTFTIGSGSLPAGLTLNSSSGAITGTPTAAGDQSLTVTATHSAGGSATSSSFTLTMAKGAQSITWSPSTDLTLADSGLALSATRAVGDGTLGYSVVSQGTTGCAVSGSTLTFSSIGSGANGCEVRPTLSATANYNAKNDASTVTFDVTQGTFALSAPSSKVGTSSSSFTNVCTSSCDVSGFAAADEVLVVINESDGSALTGEVKLGSTTGLTQSLTGYQADATQSGLYEIAFEGTPSEVNAALETLQYKSPAGGGDETIQISASLSGATYSTDTGHYYEVVNVGSAVGWEDARCRAKYGDSSAHDDSAGLTQTDDECTNTGSRRTFNGLNGYLANIASLDEHNFLRTKLNDVGWIGGADLDTEGTFQWVDGPEAGQTFFIAGTSTRRTTNTIDGASQFNYFSDGEPNNSSDEDFVEFGFGSNGVGSSWNDCRNACSRPRFVIEYGGDGGTVLKQASNTFDVGAPTAPLQVTGATASAGNGQVALSWTAPGSGGSAITDYVIEQLDPDGSTWTTLTDGVSTSTSFTVTGLTNGTSYSFRVSAKNTIGTGTVSSTVSATPTVPAPSGGGGSSGVSSPAPVVVAPTPAQPRIITPPQPTPTPSVLLGPVTSPGRGFDPSIGTRATVGGAPSTVAKRALPGGVSVQTGAFQFGMQLTEPQSGGGVDTNTPSNSPEIRVPTGQSTQFAGGGLLPGSQLQVWLPGRTGGDARELARVPVKDDGTFDTELSFTARQSEAPVPIGRQVMQVAGFDENGNQTVVDMTINVSQGPIAPELNREQGVLPDLSVGSSLATSAGFPTPVTVLPLPNERRVSVGDGSWNLRIDVDAETGVVGGTSEAPVIQVTQDSVGSASGDGFMPGTTASVWMFSDPTLMGTVTVGADGSFTTEFVVDSQFLPVGAHTLQIQGVGGDGFIKAANLGVEVQEPIELTAGSATGLLWWVVGAFVMLLVVFFLVVVVRRRSRRSAN
ncbi:putative Ig domain-containing protein [Pontimonas sp.]|nr:putative Ig domain-containing protein [Pontimonas sp.]MDA8887098.1 putative Ig domain-containing protein [Pontimonas sp.]